MSCERFTVSGNLFWYAEGSRLVNLRVFFSSAQSNSCLHIFACGAGERLYVVGEDITGSATIVHTQPPSRSNNFPKTSVVALTRWFCLLRGHLHDRRRRGWWCWYRHQAWKAVWGTITLYRSYLNRILFHHLLPASAEFPQGFVDLCLMHICKRNDTGKYTQIRTWIAITQV